MYEVPEGYFFENITASTAGYREFKHAGWTDEQLIRWGMLKPLIVLATLPDAEATVTMSYGVDMSAGPDTAVMVDHGRIFHWINGGWVFQGMTSWEPGKPKTNPYVPTQVGERFEYTTGTSLQWYGAEVKAVSDEGFAFLTLGAGKPHWHKYADKFWHYRPLAMKWKQNGTSKTEVMFYKGKPLTDYNYVELLAIAQKGWESYHRLLTGKPI